MVSTAVDNDYELRDTFSTNNVKKDITNIYTDSNNSLTQTIKGEEGFSRTGSSFGAYFNVVCVVAGTGTLGIPYALKQGGWIAVLFLALSACMSFYTGRLLMECLYCKEGERLHSYPEIGEASFGRWGKFIVQIFHYTTLLGVSCLYVMLVGINVYQLAVTYNYTELPLEVWTAIGGAVIIIPYISLKTLKEVAWLSSFGALATFVVVVVSVVAGLLDLKNQTSNETQVVNWPEIPVSLATIAFSFGGNVVYPHIEASMKKPKSWTKVLGFSMTTIFLFYALIGIVGYYVYGIHVQSPIMKSLPAELPNTIATATITLHVILVIPITLCAFSLEVEKRFNIDREHYSKINEFLIRSVIRLVALISLSLIAIYVPDFPFFMSLLGALSNCAVVFIIPIICHVKLFGFKGRPYWEYLWMLLVLIVALVGCILGAYLAIVDIVNKYTK